MFISYNFSPGGFSEARREQKFDGLCGPLLPDSQKPEVQKPSAEGITTMRGPYQETRRARVTN